jgi:hypothetical protein
MMNEWKRTGKEIKAYRPKSNMFARLLISMAVLACCISAVGQISIDGRYWQYGDQPVLLIGGWNHGHNPFIDHDTQNADGSKGVSTVEQVTAHMDELVNAGGNYLRCVLNPGMGSGIQGFDFCVKSGSLYDMNEMTGAYWERLETFISEAGNRNIIVQLEIWDRFDLIDGSWESWPVSPFNPANNINYTSEQSGLSTSYGNFMTHPFLQGVPGHPVYEDASASRKEQYDLVRGFQEKFMDKLLSHTLHHDNVLYCMNNETHENPAWGLYWMNYIRQKANGQGKNILCTDMFDRAYEGVDGTDMVYLLNNRDKYDYIDVSQVNSRHRDQVHWDVIKGIADQAKVENYLMHMTKVYGNDEALGNQPWSSFQPGDSDNAIEEMWQNLLAGVAGIRFHRPPSGIGLTDMAKNCIRAVRKIETKVKFWNVEHRLDLLTERDDDEAYLAADPGEAYIFYFTANGGGSVGIDLTDYADTDFDLSWVDIGTGEGGSTVTVTRPGSGHWAMAMARNSIVNAKRNDFSGNPFSLSIKGRGIIYTGNHAVRTIGIFDLTGNCINVFNVTSENFFWEGNNSRGHSVAAGLYFIRLNGPEKTHVVKTLLHEN